MGSLVQTAGTGITAGLQLAGGVMEGVSARKQKMREAEAYMEANQRRKAAMSREISEEERRKELMESRFRAVAAAQGGGGFGTAGMTRLLGDLNAEGEYRILAALWTGMSDAEALTFRARSAMKEGQAAFEAAVLEGITQSISTIMSSSSSGGGFMEAFGMGGMGSAGGAAAGGGGGSMMGGAGLAMFSDERLKENVTFMGYMEGHRIYAWRWNKLAEKLGIDGPRLGVMASEIPQEFVTEDERGYKMVNYGGLFSDDSIQAISG